MDENRFVDDEEPIVELVRLLDRERVAMLRIELRHIYGVKEVSCDGSSRRAPTRQGASAQ